MVRRLRLNEQEFEDTPLWMKDLDDSETVDFDRAIVTNPAYKDLRKITSRYNYDLPRWVYWDKGRLEFVLRPSSTAYKYLPDIHISTKNPNSLNYNIELNEPAFASKEELIGISKSYENVLRMLNDIEQLDLEDLESV